MVHLKKILIGKGFENQTSLWRHAAVLIVFALVAVLLYSKAAQGPFVFDDTVEIVENRHVHMTRLTTDALWEAGFKNYCGRRPVANISFALNYFIHGPNPFGFKAVNIAIHVLSSFFLYLLIGATLNLPGSAKYHGPNHLAPFFAALIFLVHPVQTEAVSYISERTACMGAMFYILALLLYVKGRMAVGQINKIFLFAFGACSFILAVGTKETALMLPVMVVLYEWFFIQDQKPKWIRQNLKQIGAAACLCVIIALAYLSLEPGGVFSGYAALDFTPGQRVLTQFRVIFFYITLLLFPHPGRMNLDHDFLVSTGVFLTLSTLVCAIIIAGLLIWAIFNAKKYRFMSFCVFWFFINLAIESSIIGLEMVSEHRLYLPSMFVSAAFAILIFAAIKNRRVAQIALLCVILLLCMTTYQRNRVWADELVLWKDCVKKSSDKWQPNYRLGLVLSKRGMTDEAIGCYRDALRVDPKNVSAHNALGIALDEQGHAKEALEHHLEALRINPDCEKTLNNLGVALSRRNRTDEAIMHFFKALRIAPDNSETHNNLGTALSRQGKTDEAIAHFFKALRIDTDSAETHNNLGTALIMQRRVNEAVTHYMEALRIKPDYKNAHYNLGVTLNWQGKTDKAIEHFLEALRIDPGFVDVHNRLGITFFENGDFGKALSHFKEALRLDPDCVSAKKNLELALSRMKNMGND